MTSQVAVARKLVETEVKRPARLLALVPEHPVIAGVKWILANRRAPDGSTWSMRALSRAAGQSPQYVEQLLSTRPGKGGRINPDGASHVALRGLATAGGVSFEWLMTGVGSPDSEAPPPRASADERFPSRGRFVDFARARGAPAVVLKHLQETAFAETEDPGFDHWAKEYERLLAEYNQVAKLVGVVEAGRDLEEQFEKRR
jgi:hypothetical protein